MKVVTVIPAFNEEKQIKNSIEEVKDICPCIVVVNDGSTDRTLEILKSISGITVLNHMINRGQGAALRTGTEYALKQGADLVVHFDSDGQQEPREIKEMVRVYQEKKVDIVMGSRFLGKKSNMPFLKKCVIKGGILFTYLHSGLRMTDAHNGFRVMNRKAASKIRITQDRMAHASEIVAQVRTHKLRWVESPVTVRYTDYSLAKGQKSSQFMVICRDLFFAKWIKK